ncbi:MAG: hypothetical protein GY866_08495 [Proteobacteria bacterium]|nr:hypothetical protein [Pseudomonadota bacterium]
MSEGIAVDSANDILITGYRYIESDDSEDGVEQVLLVDKYDSSGIRQWSRHR